MLIYINRGYGGCFDRFNQKIYQMAPYTVACRIVEKLPEVSEDYSTNIPGLYIVGDLTGIPLLKFSSDSGAKAVDSILDDPDFQKKKEQVERAFWIW